MHEPVLLEKTIANLVTDPHGIYVDCTVGGGGHLKYLITKLEPDARIIGFDKDFDILQETQKTVSQSNIKFVHADFRYLTNVLSQMEISQVDGIMMDLGVSSFQLDEAERGFSFHGDARLDMRMDRQQSFNAWDIVNTYTEEEISNIIYSYGEERYARRIARGIVNYRQEKSIDTTGELVDIIKSCVPAAYRREKHPARKTFQALRIMVNGELEALQEVLSQTIALLKPGGRLCIITFHSLEDRIVKKFMQAKSRECICPPGLPICICNHQAELKIVKPIVPDSDESSINPRARSARLRIAIKI